MPDQNISTSHAEAYIARHREVGPELSRLIRENRQLREDNAALAAELAYIHATMTDGGS